MAWADFDKVVANAEGLILSYADLVLNEEDFSKIVEQAQCLEEEEIERRLPEVSVSE